MSCRRKDNRDLVGCNIGAVAIRGCSRECCPYSDQDRNDNERISYGELASWQGFDKDSSFLDTSSPNHRPCRHHYRPKCVCVPCRRTFKLHFHPNLEYHHREFDNTYFCRPRGATFSAQCAFFGLNGRSIRHFEEIELRRGAILSSATKLSDEELRELRKIDPWIWMPLADLRCPGCGHPGRLVGTTFEAPPRKDVKGWKIVAKKIEEGEQFLFCPSQAKHEDLMAEGRRMMRKKAEDTAWDMEKSRRIAALKTVPSTRLGDEESRDCDMWEIVSDASSWLDTGTSLDGFAEKVPTLGMVT
ncbi:hypothetical protein SCHPADRAFT_881300 [Schizopora paradoxa]|uniref:Uncharacterized protein n=1 Tax=Schizopora paradoxa TaxID=27342 RepID=A0A0H2RDU4_9AGAM|nr:hypothetical protein SCHPADRAFT_881300 [Schizopora paradoxa]